jgi:hypothetical protein
MNDCIPSTQPVLMVALAAGRDIRPAGARRAVAC